MKDIELLRQLRDGLPGVRPEQREAARAALLDSVKGRPASTRRAPVWRSRRAKLAVAGLALAALLVALPLAVFGGSGKVEPAAAQVLRQAAAVAADQEPTTPGPDQFLYTRSKSAYLQATGEWSVLVPSVHESWVSFDGSRRGRVRTVSGKARFVSEDQRAGWVAAGSPRLPRAGQVEDTTLSGASVIDATGLPTEPAALRELIEAREIPGVEGPPGEAETFVLIGDMLRQSYLPAAIRSALYEGVAELPRVELLGDVRDPVGRPGIGVAFTDSKRGTRQELIFDPATSALLGERVSLVRSGAYDFDAPPGTPIGYAAYLESKVVDSVGREAPQGAGGLDNSVGCYDRASLHTDTTIVHGADPIATCAELWREGVVDTRLRRLEREGRIEKRPDRNSPHLVACTNDGHTAHVFPAPGPAVCRRLGLVPLPAK